MLNFVGGGGVGGMEGESSKVYLYGQSVSGEHLAGLERSFPREGTWVNFCWVCPAGLSEPLPHHSIFCGHIIDPILVTLGKTKFRNPNLK